MSERLLKKKCNRSENNYTSNTDMRTNNNDDISDLFFRVNPKILLAYLLFARNLHKTLHGCIFCDDTREPKQKCNGRTRIKICKFRRAKNVSLFLFLPWLHFFVIWRQRGTFAWTQKKKVLSPEFQWPRFRQSEP